MKGVVITEENKKQVYGRLEKFFKHQNFVIWHQFDCGMKKRLGHYINVKEPFEDVLQKYDVMREANGCSCYNYVKTFSIYGSYEVFSVHYGDCVTEFKVGDEVLFLGNRIIVKQPFKHCIEDVDFLYLCIQIKK